MTRHKSKVDRLSFNALSWVRLLQNVDLSDRFICGVMHSATDGLDRESADKLYAHARAKYHESTSLKIVPMAEYAEREFWLDTAELDVVAPQIPFLAKFCTLNDMAERYGDEISPLHPKHDEIQQILQAEMSHNHEAETHSSMPSPF